jgi:hypothetical protein
MVDVDAAVSMEVNSETIMRKWLRRIRGAIGMGFAWAIAWAAVGAVPRWVFGVNTDLPIGLLLGLLGFLGGVTFSAVLALTERRRSLDQLSLPRFAGWGAAGGLLVAAVFAEAASLGWGDVLVIVPTFAGACAVSASGSLAMARRVMRRELPGSRADIAETELNDQEPRKLLGNGD